MNDFTETTAENLRFLRGAKGLNQAEIGALIGLEPYHVSSIETKRRALSPSEKKLLDLYFFGVMPEGMVRSDADLSESLDLTEDEWRIITVLASRAGKSSEEWIKGRIQDYLGYLNEKSHPARNIEQFPKAAEAPTDYGTKKVPATGKSNAPTIAPPHKRIGKAS